MNHVHLVKVRFDRRRPDITQEWLETRYAFFVDNTAYSLSLQTNHKWILWINCQEGMEDAVGTLQKTFQDGANVKSNPDPFTPIRVIFSFGDGPCTLPPESLVGNPAYVYVTRIDSDDLFASDALEIVSNQFPSLYGDVEALMFRRGYIHDVRSGKVGVFNNPSTPFHTIMFPIGVFTDPEQYAKVWHKIGDHSRVGSELHCQYLPDFKFTVLVHGKNFLSTFDYSRERNGSVPAGWTIDQFLDPPVVFDVDDFSDRYGGGDTLDDLLKLKERYPKFKCTLFTIPARIDHKLLEQARQYNWIELGVHGWTHEPVEELKSLSPAALLKYLDALPHTDGKPYAKVFRPPGWYITREHIDVLNRLGYAVALNKRDVEKLSPYCKHGYYACEERLPYWHGHTHDVCGNYLRKALPELLEGWKAEQSFAFVSEGVLVRT